MDISNFYTNVWWEDILDWEDKYGIVHTGMIIEDHSDTVEEPFTRTESTRAFPFLWQYASQPRRRTGIPWL